MNNKKIRKWLRAIHRDLGYFFVGVILIYGVSGILLNHEISAYSTYAHKFKIEQQLDKEALEKQIKQDYSDFKLNKIIPNKKGFQIFIEGGVGQYENQTGMLHFETYKRYALIDFVHRLHYNTIRGWKYMADFFAAALIFFAISGLFLTRGKKGVARRGKWFVIAGISITLLIFFL